MKSFTKMSPFGIRFADGISLSDFSPSDIHEFLAAHSLLLFPRAAVPTDDEMRSYCASLGTILEWEFGSINKLEVKEGSPNYLYTNREVPMHWDGAFVGKVPWIIFFSCVAAPPSGSGGETTFCDTVALLNSLPSGEVDTWKSLTLTYETEKIVHYGGKFSSSLLGVHPKTGKRILRYAEPVKDLNPVHVSIDGLSGESEERFFSHMRELLNDPKVCYAHEWSAGDIVIADNHALLHGRRAFLERSTRSIRRINVL